MVFQSQRCCFPFDAAVVHFKKTQEVNKHIQKHMKRCFWTHKITSIFHSFASLPPPSCWRLDGTQSSVTAQGERDPGHKTSAKQAFLRGIFLMCLYFKALLNVFFFGMSVLRFAFLLILFVVLFLIT